MICSPVKKIDSIDMTFTLPTCEKTYATLMEDRPNINLPIRGCPNSSLNVFDAKDEFFGVEMPT